MNIKEYKLLNALSPNSFRQRAIPNKGFKHSEETRKKISAANSLRVRTEDSKKRVSDSLKNFYKQNEHVKELMSERSKGKNHTQESKDKIRAARLKATIYGSVSEETRKKISIANKGKVISKETKEKISKANKGKIRGPQSEEHKRKIAESCRISRLKKKELFQLI